MYEETYRLFSHRPDIKAKHSHISAKRKAKANGEDIEIIYALLTTVIIFIMACTFAIL